MVGSGGIGCELLKNLILMGYGEIHIVSYAPFYFRGLHKHTNELKVDLDTIDLSNLNRQFLFGREDIKKPKSTVAVKAVEPFNANSSKLVAHHGNVMDTELFDLSWFSQFSIIFNALDNLEARAYINKIVLTLAIPLIETGTMGFNGQVQVILPGKSECFDCNPKQKPKSFPVCTIRSTPSQPVHCVAWAKSFLFNQLFGPPEDITEEKQEDEDDPDKRKELENQKRESNELKQLRDLLLDSKDANNLFEKVAAKIFVDDIKRLLTLDTLWKFREAPKIINLEQEVFSKFENLNRKEVLASISKIWSLEENFLVLKDSIERLQARVLSTYSKTNEIPELEFDKDDQDTLDFVVAAANIRCYIFHITVKSAFDVKQIAGNIIPAIATTNAIIAGFAAMQSIKILPLKGQNEEESKANSTGWTFLKRLDNSLISSSRLHPRNPHCPSCFNISRAVVKINPLKLTLKTLINDLFISKWGFTEELSIIKESNLIYDVDFDDNIDKTASELGFKDSSFIVLMDDDGVKVNVEVFFDISLKDGYKDFATIINDIPDKITIPEEEAEEEGEVVQSTTKPVQVDSNGIISLELDSEVTSPTEGKRKLEIQGEDTLSTESPSKKIKLNDSDGNSVPIDTITLEDEDDGAIVID